MKAGFGFAVGGAVFGAVIFVGASVVAFIVVHRQRPDAEGRLTFGAGRH